MNDKIEKLRDLFRQREAIDAEIVRVLEGGALPDKKPLPEAPTKKRGLKPRIEPAKTGKKCGRKPKDADAAPKWKPKGAADYACKDCGHTFMSTLPKNEVSCPECFSEHISEAAV